MYGIKILLGMVLISKRWERLTSSGFLRVLHNNTIPLPLLRNLFQGWLSFVFPLFIGYVGDC